MARPIEATPILKGKDAETFLSETSLSQPLSQERLEWMERLAQESKDADRK